MISSIRQRNETVIDRDVNRVLLVIVTLWAAALSAGCVGSYGRISRNPDVAQMFQTGESLPDYRYYYTGRSNLPDAVIGIRPEYTLKSRLWHPLESKEKVLQTASRIGLNESQRARGAVILDENNTEIGIWFSTYTSTTVKKLSDTEVIVYSPYSPSDSIDFPGIRDD